MILTQSHQQASKTSLQHSKHNQINIGKTSPLMSNLSNMLGGAESVESKSIFNKYRQSDKGTHVSDGVTGGEQDTCDLITTTPEPRSLALDASGKNSSVLVGNSIGLGVLQGGASKGLSAKDAYQVGVQQLKQNNILVADQKKNQVVMRQFSDTEIQNFSKFSKDANSSTPVSKNKFMKRPTV
jgi:hypothetical protein